MRFDSMLVRFAVVAAALLVPAPANAGPILNWLRGGRSCRPAAQPPYCGQPSRVQTFVSPTTVQPQPMFGQCGQGACPSPSPAASFFSMPVRILPASGTYRLNSGCPGGVCPLQ